MIFKISLPKNLQKYWRFLLKLLLVFAKIEVITLVFEKIAHLFAKNWQKSQKIVIITSAPGHFDFFFHFPVSQLHEIGGQRPLEPEPATLSRTEPWRPLGPLRRSVVRSLQSRFRKSFSYCINECIFCARFANVVAHVEVKVMCLCLSGYGFRQLLLRVLFVHAITLFLCTIKRCPNVEYTFNH
jgi:hypothetical protein